MYFIDLYLPYSNYPEQIEHIAFILKKKNYENTTMPSNAKVYLNDLS